MRNSNKQYTKILTLLTNHLKEQWTPEQKFYGGAKSSFTWVGGE
jgi:hypothetical protein